MPILKLRKIESFSGLFSQRVFEVFKLIQRINIIPITLFRRYSGTSFWVECPFLLHGWFKWLYILQAHYRYYQMHVSNIIKEQHPYEWFILNGKCIARKSSIFSLCFIKNRFSLIFLILFIFYCIYDVIKLICGNRKLNDIIQKRLLMLIFSIECTA